jgi:hypothetical protein
MLSGPFIDSLKTILPLSQLKGPCVRSSFERLELNGEIVEHMSIGIPAYRVYVKIVEGRSIFEVDQEDPTMALEY